MWYTYVLPESFCTTETRACGGFRCRVQQETRINVDGHPLQRDKRQSTGTCTAGYGRTGLRVKDRGGLAAFMTWYKGPTENQT